MLTRKKGFSFLELLIVMMIISVLVVVFRSSFQIKNKDILYGQACIETLYGQVNNFLYAGLTSKGVFSGSTPIFPDEYSINFQPSNGLIELKYKTRENNGDILYNSIKLSENTNIGYCSSNSYIIEMTGEDYEIHINKGLQKNENLSSFYLSGNTLINTGETLFLQCNNQGTGCKTMARFESDTRTISLRKQMCLSFTETGDCYEWDN